MEENFVRQEVVMDWSVKYAKFAIQEERIKLWLENNYLELLANLNDWKQRNVKKEPVKSIISFDKSAKKRIKKLPEIMLLKTSSPPIAINNPKRTTICINNFFFDEYIKPSVEKNKIGTPRNKGISDVIE